MNLIDILVEETIENGWSWPERANCITQDRDREIMPATCQSSVAKFEASFNRWFLNGSRVDCFTADVLASDYETAVITREQYETALAAKNDGWIEWGGGECPVGASEMVDVIFGRGGRMSTNIADCWRWSHSGTDSDIISYRLHKPQEATEADDEADLNDCIGQDVVPTWSRDGLPPVGCECEAKQFAQINWNKFKVVTVNSGAVFGFWDNGVDSALDGDKWEFRPIRSEADKKREEVIMSLAGAVCSAHFTYGEKLSDGQLPGSMWYELYDAIAAGKVRGVKLED